MTKAVSDETPERLREAEPDQVIGPLAVAKRQRSHDPAPGARVVELRAASAPPQPRPGIWQYLQLTPLAYVLAAPFIYGMIIPLLILDASATLYQHACFRAWGIPRLRRLDYLVVDRHRLPYLNAFEKLNCVYCAYATQLMEYAREINARTEQFFCPIKHARRTLNPHRRTEKFFEYGDAEAYLHDLDLIRRDWGK